MKKLFKMTSASLVLLAIGSMQAAHAEPRRPQQEHTVFSKDGVKVKLSTGLDYSTGDYGDAEDTEIWYAPVTGKIQKDNITLKLTVPYISIKGPGSVIGDGDVSSASSGTTTTTESGLGDVVGALTYTFDLTPDTYLDLTGKVKFPTADEDKGLGTGETDYTINTEITQQFGKSYVYGSAGYKFVGDNDTLDLDNSVLLGVGGGTKVTENTSVGLSYDWRESASGGDNPSEASAFVSHSLTERVNIQAYGVTGFSDASPDIGGGAMVGYKFY